MNTNVHIERLVLDGIKLSRRERDALGPAIARELRWLASLPLNRPPDPRGEKDRRPGSAVDGIARQVAGAVHQATAAALPATGGARRPGVSRERR
jgi:hypothetical protein